MDRRELLKLMGISGGLAMTPRWLLAAAGSGAAGGRDRVISIFLRGGADGLTICPPLGEARYFDLRPSLAVAEADALALDGFFGLNPAAGGLKALYDDGDLALVHASGLATAERSHFAAQSTMEQGFDAGESGAGDGWLGRYLNAIETPGALAAVALDTAVPQSMAGTPSALAVASIEDFGLGLGADARAALAAMYDGAPALEPTADGVFDAAAALAPVADIPGGEGYPEGPLGAALADTARLIKGETGLLAGAVNGGGWDHHDDQAARIAPLLTELGDALAAFRDDIGDQWQNTTVIVQTEFGRRAGENASAGTDHGHGGVMLAAGGGVNGGAVYGDWPGLGSGDLSAGEDLAVTTDYRQVLAELLARRLALADTGAVFADWRPGSWQGIFRSRAA